MYLVLTAPTGDILPCFADTLDQNVDSMSKLVKVLNECHLGVQFLSPILALV